MTDERLRSGLVPGGGWLVTWVSPAHGKPVTEPVVAWEVLWAADGTRAGGSPLIATNHLGDLGSVSEVMAIRTSFVVWHPDVRDDWTDVPDRVRTQLEQWEREERGEW